MGSQAMGNCGTKKGAEAAGVTEPTTTRAVPTLVEEAGAQGKVETVGEQIVEAAAEAKADVVAVVEAVQEKIAEVVSEEKVAETVTEIKEAIADAVEKVEAEIGQVVEVEGEPSVERRKKFGCC